MLGVRESGQAGCLSLPVVLRGRESEIVDSTGDERSPFVMVAVIKGDVVQV